MNLNFSANIYQLKFRFLYDNYKTTSRDGFDKILADDYRWDFKTIISDISNDFKIGNKITITPKINYKHSKPWNAWNNPVMPEDSIYMNSMYYIRTVERYTANITGLYDINKKINLLLGGEYYKDIAKDLTDFPEKVFMNDQKEIQYNNISLFGQILIQNRIANLTVGGRFEKHSYFDAAFAPRFALTKVLNVFHFKLILSKAFRSPGVENIDLNAKLNRNKIPDIKPESLYIGEFEAGFKVNNKMILTINLFHMLLNNPIVYFVDQETGDEGYKNKERTGSKGVEFEYRYIDNWGYANINFSYYDTKGINNVEDYAVFENDALLLGAPQYKVNFYSNIKISKKISINPSFTYLSERYTYSSFDEYNEIAVQQKTDPVYLFNFFINYDNLFVTDLNLGAGIYNILNTKYLYIQPYSGLHAPLPGCSREIIVKLSYNFKL